MYRDFVKSTRKNIALVIVITVVMFISSQFVVMATISTRGADIGTIRKEQELLRYENEDLRAKINAAKTTEEIMSALDDRYELKQVRANELVDKSTKKK